MGLCSSRNRAGYGYEKDPRIFIQKMRLLQQEINAILKQSEEDSEAYEREMMVFTFKKAEWRREKKKLQDEVKRLRKGLEEREERIRRMEEEVGNGGKSEKSVEQSGESTTTTTTTTTSLLLVEQMREERARRDETVEKWKMLYLAIKNELDDLIQRTHEGTLYWRADEEDLMEEMQRELKAKDETIEFLKTQIASMEDDDYKTKREVDILRQSLRIISNKKGTASSTSSVKSFTEASPILTNRLKSLHM